MPQNRSRPEPPEPMTWGRALPVLAVAVVFDALRFMFEMFWFFGPAIAGFICTATASGTVGTTVAGIACGAGATAVGVLAVGPIQVLGVVMAMATGLAGWLTVGLLLLVTNARIFKENALWFAGSLLVSEVPVVGSIPAITLVLWRMYHVQIRKEKADAKAYAEERTALALQERQRQASYAMQAHNERLAQAEAQEAANEDEYRAGEEIPDTERRAA